ncbi:tektin-3-like [Watersipora subatra]|uniref:tektin-3-like n=1 Tax=Watersipora subatra TaxID=2589382 RepID=UPI00355C70BF
MEYRGNRQISTYMTSLEPLGKINGVMSTVGNLPRGWKGYDTYPAPAPLRRSLTTLPWAPSVYYSTAKVNSSVASESKVPVPQASTNQMTRCDEVKVPSLFSAARNALYTRYAPEDWSRHKRNISADQVRASGERLRMESNRLATELDDKTKHTIADVGNKLGGRISDVKFWKREVDAETEAMIGEMEQLNRARQALETFLKETDNQAHIAKECLYEREKRTGIDLVHDGPERALITEIDLTHRMRELAKAQLSRVNAQLNLNRAAQHELEKDSSDKHAAANIDTAAFNLKETSRGISVHSGVHRIDNTKSVPESWAEYTHNNVSRSQAERNASKGLRNDLQSMLKHAGSELWNQWNKVNTELSRRVRETMEARNKIQAHLSGTLQEIFDTDRSMALLEKAIQDKVNPLKVATTRLSSRLHRPNMESCRDAAQVRLIQEVNEIDESIESLTGQIRDTENQLQTLHRKRADLEQDLATKNNTLFIDREKCMGMRKTYPMQDRIWQLV